METHVHDSFVNVADTIVYSQKQKCGYDVLFVPDGGELDDYDEDVVYASLSKVCYWLRSFSRDGITLVRNEMTWTILISSGVKERRKQFWSVYAGVAIANT